MLPTLSTDPLLYDRMIRQFQSNSEREAEGRKKGYSGVLEADLLRSEAKVEALKHPNSHGLVAYKRDAAGSITAIQQDGEDRPTTKDEGRDRWREYIEQRFLRGEDTDFDYREVDENDQYDDRAEDTRRMEDLYFDEEEADSVVDEQKQGETGIQDF